MWVSEFVSVKLYRDNLGICVCKTCTIPIKNCNEENSDLNYKLNTSCILQNRTPQYLHTSTPLVNCKWKSFGFEITLTDLVCFDTGNPVQCTRIYIRATPLLTCKEILVKTNLEHILYSFLNQKLQCPHKSNPATEL